PHFRPIRRQPAHFQRFTHAHLDQKLPQQQNSLSSEAGDLDLDVFKMMGRFWFGRIGCSGFRSNFKHIRDCSLRWFLASWNFRAAVAENIQRKSWRHLIEHPAPRINRIFAPNGWARRQYFYKREARAIPLEFERFTDC